jgi:2-succinyl-5-enolpyruvyl-6-hydroxy-3-cyclohexene-1-carboxylate synthase
MTPPAIRWANLFVEALAQAGLTAVCIAPGSRSTPLVLAFAAHPQIDITVHLDERSAAFFALGRALATDKPVAVVCTSGTAAANFYPALIEAKMSHVPLLLLTADRPPELRHSGANQTIDQVKMYGDNVLWAVDMGVPHDEAPPAAVRHVATTAARAYAIANGRPKGPVQVNFPFRKPLEGNFAEGQRGRGAEEMPRLSSAPLLLRSSALPPSLPLPPHGLIICGPRCPSGEFPHAVAKLSCATGYPILADPLSGVRWGEWVAETAVLGGYESFLGRDTDPNWPEPEIVIRFGQVPTSKWLNSYLERIHPTVRLHVRGNGQWADDAHQTTHFWEADEVAACEALASQLVSQSAIRNPQSAIRNEQVTWDVVNYAFAGVTSDAAAVWAAVQALPAGANLVMGNSLPIRHLDQFGQPSPKPLRVFGNRGASGIDGNTSTALGVASADPTRPTLLITGDITFYHDLNGLLAIQHNQIHNLTILLLNNNGGGIFQRLPVAAVYDEQSFNRLFITPHNLNFSHAAALYGLEYVPVPDVAGVTVALTAENGWQRPRLIELHTNSVEDEQLRRQVVTQVLEKIASMK